MNNKIYYILPDFLNVVLNEIIINIYEKRPELTRDNTSIYSFFGTFPNAIWNGGSYVIDQTRSTKKEMKKIRDFYNKRGIKITFTFTNSLITEEHLGDEYCNLMLKIFHNGMNEVLVVSPILEKYIRKYYPKYKINRSIIASENGELILKNYNLTVLSKFKNRDFDFLNSLTIEERSKIELLCDESCINDCKWKYEHYREYANIQMGIKSPTETYGQCRHLPNPHYGISDRFLTSNYYISPEDIQNKYSPMGFKYFKCSGRGQYNPFGYNTIIKYCIKPQYHSDIIIYVYETILMEIERNIKKELKCSTYLSKLISSDKHHFNLFN